MLLGRWDFSNSIKGDGSNGSLGSNNFDSGHAVSVII